MAYLFSNELIPSSKEAYGAASAKPVFTQTLQAAEKTVYFDTAPYLNFIYYKLVQIEHLNDCFQASSASTSLKRYSSAMWPTNSYLDLPHIVSKHPHCFRSILIYDPQPSPDGLNGINIVSKPLSISADAIWIELPKIFSLISVSQIQICVVNGYGELSVQTAAAQKNRQSLILTQGGRYKRDIQPEELTDLQIWRDRAFHHIANNHAR